MYFVFNLCFVLLDNPSCVMYVVLWLSSSSLVLLSALSLFGVDVSHHLGHDLILIIPNFYNKLDKTILNNTLVTIYNHHHRHHHCHYCCWILSIQIELTFSLILLFWHYDVCEQMLHFQHSHLSNHLV